MYPLKSRHLATHSVHALSLFYVLKRRNINSRYAATWLCGYVATLLRGYMVTELPGYGATLIKERVRFMCSVLVSAHGFLFRHIDWELNSCVALLSHVEKQALSTKAPSLASSRVAL